MTNAPLDPYAGGEGREPTEDELRAAYEAEMKRVRVEDVVVQTAVSLINLGARKVGLAPGSEDERDLDQVQMAIDGARALLPLVEPQLGPDAASLRDALSQLQMAYVQLVGEGAPAPGDAPPAPGSAGGSGAPDSAGDAPSQGESQGAGPAQQSGRLWIPGQ